jgi:hypothetical protein
MGKSPSKETIAKRVAGQKRNRARRRGCRNKDCAATDLPPRRRGSRRTAARVATRPDAGSSGWRTSETSFEIQKA